MTETPQKDSQPMPEGFEPLFDRMRAQSDVERATIRTEAEKTIEAIKSETKAEKLNALEEGQKDLDGLADSIRRKAVNQAQRARRDRVRREIGSAVDRILDTCREQAATLLDDPSFTSRLGQFLKEAMCCAQTYRDRVGGGDLEVVVHPKLAEAVRKVLADRGQTAIVTESETAETGVLVVLQETPYRIINTVESRLLKNEENLRSLISKRLTEAMEETHSE